MYVNRLNFKVWKNEPVSEIKGKIIKVNFPRIIENPFPYIYRLSYEISKDFPDLICGKFEEDKLFCIGEIPEFEDKEYIIHPKNYEEIKVKITSELKFIKSDDERLSDLYKEAIRKAAKKINFYAYGTSIMAFRGEKIGEWEIFQKWDFRVLPKSMEIEIKPRKSILTKYTLKEYLNTERKLEEILVRDFEGRVLEVKKIANEEKCEKLIDYYKEKEELKKYVSYINPDDPVIYCIFQTSLKEYPYPPTLLRPIFDPEEFEKYPEIRTRVMFPPKERFFQILQFPLLNEPIPFGEYEIIIEKELKKISTIRLKTEKMLKIKNEYGKEISITKRLELDKYSKTRKVKRRAYRPPIYKDLFIIGKSSDLREKASKRIVTFLEELSGEKINVYLINIEDEFNEEEWIEKLESIEKGPKAALVFMHQKEEMREKGLVHLYNIVHRILILKEILPQVVNWETIETLDDVKLFAIAACLIPQMGGQLSKPDLSDLPLPENLAILGLDVAEFVGASIVADKECRILGYPNLLMLSEGERISSQHLQDVIKETLNIYKREYNTLPELLLIFRHGRFLKGERESLKEAIEKAKISYSFLQITERINTLIFDENAPQYCPKPGVAYLPPDEPNTGYLVPSKSPVIQEGKEERATPSVIRVKLIESNYEKLNIKNALDLTYRLCLSTEEYLGGSTKLPNILHWAHELITFMRDYKIHLTQTLLGARIHV